MGSQNDLDRCMPEKIITDESTGKTYVVPSFGPCQYCGYEPTSAFTGAVKDIAPTCGLCLEKIMGRAQPEHYSI